MSQNVTITIIFERMEKEWEKKKNLMCLTINSIVEKRERNNNYKHKHQRYFPTKSQVYIPLIHLKIQKWSQFIRLLHF